QAREPASDIKSWRRFLETIYSLDKQGRIADLIANHREDVMTILSSPYLDRIFWQDPSEEARQKTSDKAFISSKWFVQERWLSLLDLMMHRIYVLRCQCIHGAATYQSNENREVIYHCQRMLGRVLEAVLLIWIDDEAMQDWGPLCYPPVS
ncbi:MAG: hypothetical protein ACF8OB_08785, partial [Phycisphaeraceae bacterium JB051]